VTEIPEAARNPIRGYMNTESGPLFIVAGDLRGLLADAAPGKRRLVAAGPGATVSFALCDTFDGEIALTGRLLLCCDGRLDLIGPDGCEASQPGMPPGFLPEMPGGAVTDALSGIVSPLRRVLELGSGQLLHQRFALLDDEEKTRARCDLTVLEPDSDRAVTLVRLEPLRGYRRDCDRLVSHLRGIAGAVPLGARATAARLFPDAAGYDPKPAVPFAPDESVLKATGDVIAAHLPVARANEPGILADLDSEFLHDYRVALRKIRSVLSLFRGVYTPKETEKLKARFAALMAETGRLRDLDVYLIERDHYLRMVPEGLRPGLDLLFDGFARDRAAAHRRLTRHLRSAGYGKEMDRLSRLFAKPGKHLAKGSEADRPVRDYARALIWARYRKVRKIAASIDATTPDERVHALRIQCKKLRYLMEFFAPLYGEKPMKRLIRSLKILQENLGAFNDSVVQQEALENVLSDRVGKQGAQQLEIARSLGALLTVLHQRQTAERARVMATFAAFDVPATRAGFRALFAAEGGR